MLTAKNTQKGVNRLKNVLLSDKFTNPERLNEVIKSDILYVLKNYMDIDTDDIKLNFTLNDDGNYQLRLSASCKRLKLLQAIL
ncbi:MAG: cell division topological specificity factor MinE [Clostridia bacterium]|jgi:septum formation topological specificity factor MinE|nr:cell division topological specificity factor MinE [Clostridia bacterium]MDD4275512.1 cell division topological specificity factor MinE [Clostridia bacterium]